MYCLRSIFSSILRLAEIFEEPAASVDRNIDVGPPRKEIYGVLMTHAVIRFLEYLRHIFCVKVERLGDVIEIANKVRRSFLRCTRLFNFPASILRDGKCSVVCKLAIQILCRV